MSGIWRCSRIFFKLILFHIIIIILFSDLEETDIEGEPCNDADMHIATKMKVPLLLSFLFVQSTASFVIQENQKRRRAFVKPNDALRLLAPRKSNYESFPSSALPMFGGIFGGGNDSKKGEDGVLALYSNLAFSDVKFESLSDYIQNWSKLFETDPKRMKLTTPVKVAVLSASSSAEESNDDDDIVAAFTGVRLLFQSIETGYKSKKEEALEQNEAGTTTTDTTKNKQEEKKQGGVEILVEKLTSDEVRVRAQRCNIDEDTMIKEMSEQAIIKELQVAIDVWKKEVT